MSRNCFDSSIRSDIVATSKSGVVVEVASVGPVKERGGRGRLEHTAPHFLSRIVTQLTRCWLWAWLGPSPVLSPRGTDTLRYRHPFLRCSWAASGSGHGVKGFNLCDCPLHQAGGFRVCLGQTAEEFQRLPVALPRHDADSPLSDYRALALYCSTHLRKNLWPTLNQHPFRPVGHKHVVGSERRNC